MSWANQPCMDCGRGKINCTCAEGAKKFAARAKRYGLTPTQLKALLEMHPACWICQRVPPAPMFRRYIDHDHKTGRVRGVLCFTCNYRLLGKGALNDPKLHFAAGNYLLDGFDARKDL